MVARLFLQGIVAMISAVSFGAGCNLAGECTRGADCAEGFACVNNACIRLDDDDEDAGFADAGFPDAGFPDAGFADAGFPDAGFPDAGFPDAGFFCFDPVDDCPQSGACHSYRCVGGELCEQENFPAGTPCHGTGGACDGSGNCLECDPDSEKRCVEGCVPLSDCCAGEKVERLTLAAGADIPLRPEAGESVSDIEGAICNVDDVTGSLALGLEQRMRIGAERGAIRFDLSDDLFVAMIERRVVSGSLSVTADADGCAADDTCVESPVEVYAMASTWSEGAEGPGPNGELNGANFYQRDLLGQTPWECVGAAGPGSERSEAAVGIETLSAAGETTIFLDATSFHSFMRQEPAQLSVMLVPSNDAMLIDLETREGGAPPQLTLDVCTR